MILLRRGMDAVNARGWRHWLPVAGADPTLPSLETNLVLPGLAGRIEVAFDACRATWWTLARELQDEPSAALAHAAACNPSPSDLGAMLAWSRLVGELADEPETILAVCDDPWLFRHLAGLPGVEAGAPPPLWRRRLGLALRGVAARSMVALRAARAALATRSQRSHHQPGVPVLLVYGHPASDAQGRDAYFGSFMAEEPGLRRLLHTDCPPERAAELAQDGRTASLHAWGSPLFALSTLPWTRWRPGSRELSGPYRWLIRRAAVREGGGGQAAMTRWQMHCQERWLAAVGPRAVAWPWENQPWERPFTRAAASVGTHTVGYLHTVVGHHMWNQSANANRDGLASIPEVILCNGPGYRRDLERFGMPAERLEIGGAFRFSPVPPHRHDPAGPVFVALSSNLSVSAELMAAVAGAAALGGRRFLIKDHPMYPFAFQETEFIRRTTESLFRQPPLSAVLYCASVVGLEAMLAGLPTVRFQPTRSMAVDVLPPGVEAMAADRDQLATALEEVRGRPAPEVAWDGVFAPVASEAWRRHLHLGDGH